MRRAAEFFFRFFTPLEFVASVSLATALLLVYWFQLSFYLPDRRESAIQLTSMMFFIILPLIGRAIIQPGRALSMRGALTELLQNARMFICTAICFLIYFNLKYWAHLIRPLRYDMLYHSIDLSLAPILHRLNLAAAVLGIQNWQEGYDEIYSWLWLGAYFLVYLKGVSAAQRVLIMICVIWLLGGLGYILTPSYGPFIYAHANPDQAHFLKQTEQFHASHGKIYDGADFTNALGAMPSLHIADSVGFVYYMVAAGYIVFGGLGLAALCLLTLQAVTLQWHYLVDLPAGLFIAVIAIWFANKSVRYWEAVQEKNRLSTPGA